MESKNEEKRSVDWSKFSNEIEKACQEHRNFIKSDFIQLIANGNPQYGEEWLFVCWRNPYTDKLEIYDAGDIEEAQQLIDYYKFSKANTKVVVRATGEDFSNRVVFNPNYHDTFVI